MASTSDASVGGASEFCTHDYTSDVDTPSTPSGRGVPVIYLAEALGLGNHDADAPKRPLEHDQSEVELFDIFDVRIHAGTQTDSQPASRIPLQAEQIVGKCNSLCQTDKHFTCSSPHKMRKLGRAVQTDLHLHEFDSLPGVHVDVLEATVRDFAKSVELYCSVPTIVRVLVHEVSNALPDIAVLPVGSSSITSNLAAFDVMIDAIKKVNQAGGEPTVTALFNTLGLDPSSTRPR